MKKNCIRTLLLAGILFSHLLCLAIVNQGIEVKDIHINSGDPAFPFPQFLPYQKGINLGANMAPGLTHADMEKSIREAYEIMMNRLFYTGDEYTDVNGTTVKYLGYNNNAIDGHDSKFVSEGDGYAMLAAAYMADKTTFDGLWMWIHDNRLSKVKRYYDCTDLRPNYAKGGGLPGWKNDASVPDSDGDNDSAADADWDIGLALLMAYRQWGDDSKILDDCGNKISYKEAAVDFLKALSDTTQAYTTNGIPMGFVTGDIGFDGYAKDGNPWGELTQWAYPHHKTECKDDDGTLYACNVNGYFDYHAPGYYKAFADFLEDEQTNNEYAWNINQFKRARASSTFLMQEIYDANSLPYAGGVAVNDDGSSTSFPGPKVGNGAGENFRLPWRTIADYMWHGDPEYYWDPVNHKIVNGANGDHTMQDNADRLCGFIEKPSTWGHSPQQMGNDPYQLVMDGPMGLWFHHGQQGDGMLDMTRGSNWLHGSSMGAAVVHEDPLLLSQMYQQCEIEWDTKYELPGLVNANKTDERYIDNYPVYFHGWFRLLGMLTATGNLHSATNMKASANLKVYVDIDKTYGFQDDEVTYTISYRNYGSLDGINTKIEFDVPEEFEIISQSHPQGKIVGNKVTVGPFNATGFSSGNLALTEGDFTVKVKVIKDEGRACATATVSGSNFDPYTSNEFPNNATSTMERNCFDIVSRALVVNKESNRDEVYPGDTIAYKIDFVNSSKAGWLNGGRPNVRFMYSHGYQGSPNAITKMDMYTRIIHGAAEPYINYGNYRFSVFVNESSVEGIAPTKQDKGWHFFVEPYEGAGDRDNVEFINQKIPFGSDANGSWNQRLVVKFADQIAAPSHHLWQQYNNAHRIHKGTIEPFEAVIQVETQGLSVNYSDDWSFSTAYNASNQNDVANSRIVVPDWTDPEGTGTIPTKILPYSASLHSNTMDRILVEEFDGYGWRRVFGQGPIPGREVANVVVVDTLPQDLIFVEFLKGALVNNDPYMVTILEDTVIYDPSTHTIKWTKEALLVGEKGSIQYSARTKNQAELGLDCNVDDINFDILNRAYVYADAESPTFSEDTVNVNCDPDDPFVASSSFIKSSDKDKYIVGEEIEYTVGFAQTNGTVMNDGLNDGSLWTKKTGANKPTFNGKMKFASSNEFVLQDYSHGTNGILDANIMIDNAYNNFTIIFRYKSGTPGQANFDGVALQMHPGPWGADKGGLLAIYDGPNQVEVTDGFRSYINDIGEEAQLHISLNDDVLNVWLNKDYEVDAPTLSASGLRTQPGYAGFFNGMMQGFNGYSGGQGPENAVTKWNSHFDSAFEVELSDALPNETDLIINSTTVNFNQNGEITTTPTESNTNNEWRWQLVNNKTPMLYGDSVSITFKGTVATCIDLEIENFVYAEHFGTPNTIITTKKKNECVPNITCTPPTSIAIPDYSICEGNALQIAGTITGTPDDQYNYTWEDPNGVLTPAAASNLFDFNSIALTDSGTYILHIEDGTSGLQKCQDQKAFDITVLQSPQGTFNFNGNVAVCKDSLYDYTFSGGNYVDDVLWTTPTGATLLTDTTGLNSSAIQVNINDAADASKITATPFNTCGLGTSQEITLSLRNDCVPVVACNQPDSIRFSTYDVCETTSIQAIPNVYGDAPTDQYYYTWTLSNGTVTTANTSDVELSMTNLSLPDSGTYTLRVEDGNNGDKACYTEQSFDITVLQTPQGAFNFNGDISVCKDSVYDYTFSDGVYVEDILWTTPTGAILLTDTTGINSLAIQINIKDAADASKVTATPFNSCGLGSPQEITLALRNDCTPVTCTKPTSATITSQSDTLCKGTSMDLIAVSHAGYAYTWTSLPENNIPFIYASEEVDKTSITINFSGKYEVQIFEPGFGNDDACIVRDTIELVAYDVPQDSVIITGNAFPCPNEITTFTVQPIDSATDYLWYLPKYASNISDTTGINTTSVSFTDTHGGAVAVIPFNQCGQGKTSIIPFNIQTLPNEPTLTGFYDSVCVASEKVIKASTPGNYVWIIDDVLTAFDKDSAVVTSMPLQHVKVDVFEKSTCGNGDTLSLVMKPKELPLQAFIVPVEDVSYCAGSSYELNGIGSQFYYWTTSEGETSYVSNINFVMPNNPIEIKVVGANWCGFSAETVLNISPEPAPETPRLKSGPSNVCPKDSGVIYTIANPLPNLNYQWLASNDIILIDSVINTSVTTIFDNANGDITLKATNACGVSTDTTIQITVSALPSPPTITSHNNGNRICIGDQVTVNASGGSTYEWKVDNTTKIATSFSFTMTPTTTTIQARSQNSCGNLSLPTSVQLVAQDVPQTGAILGSFTTCANNTLNFSTPNTPFADYYNWTTDATEVTPSNTDIYEVQTGSTNAHVTLQAVNKYCGAGNIVDSIIKIEANPLPSISLVQIDTVCQGSDALFKVVLGNEGNTPILEIKSGSKTLSHGPAPDYAFSVPNVDGTENLTGKLTSNLSCINLGDEIATTTASVNIDVPAASASIQDQPTGIDSICTTTYSLEAQNVNNGVWSIKNNAAVIAGTNPITVSSFNKNEIVTAYLTERSAFGYCKNNVDSVQFLQVDDLSPTHIEKVSDNNIVCIDELNTTLKIQANNGEHISWFLEDGKGLFTQKTVTNTAFNFTPIAEGTLKMAVVKSILNGACSNTDTITVTIHEPDAALTIDLTNKDKICSGEELELVISNYDKIYTYQWSSDHSNNITHPTDASANILMNNGTPDDTITIVKWSDECKRPVKTIKHAVQVLTTPSLSSGFIDGPASVCRNDNKTYTLDGIEASVIFEGLELPLPSKNVQFGNTPGTQTVRFNVKGECFDHDYTKTVTIEDDIHELMIHHDSLPHCVGEEIVFSSNLSNVVNGKGTWFENGLETEHGKFYKTSGLTPQQNGIELTFTYALCSQKDTTLYAATQANITSVPTVTLKVSDSIITTPSTIHLCEGESFVLSTQGHSNIQWNTPLMENLIAFKEVEKTNAGLYSFSIVDSLCGVIDDNRTIELKVHTQPEVIFSTPGGTPIRENYPPNYVFFEDETQILHAKGAGLNQVNYNWEESQVLPLAEDKQSEFTLSEPKFDYAQFEIRKPIGGYKAEVTISNKNLERCFDTDSAIVNVISRLAPPTAFTPNADGTNDTWKIPGMEKYPHAEVQIYNRWGNMIFRVTGLYNSHPWNGTYGGKKVNEGTYYYIINTNDPNVSEATTGTVTVLE